MQAPNEQLKPNITPCYSCEDSPKLEPYPFGGYQLLCHECYCGEGGVITRRTEAETIADWNELQEERADPTPMRRLDIEQWTVISLAVTDDRYEFSRRPFPDEESARAYFGESLEHAKRQGGNYELWGPGGELKDSGWHWCPND